MEGCTTPSDVSNEFGQPEYLTPGFETGADAPSWGRALALAGVAGNHWGSLVQ